jgi:diguanylate cyclase (GGDEF)-like protein
VCRYGGEEMVVVVPGAALAGTRKLAEDLREGIFRSSFTDGRSRVRITASFGVATFPEGADNAADLLRAADAAMYRAKAQGRNCVVAQDE